MRRSTFASFALLAPVAAAPPLAAQEKLAAVSHPPTSDSWPDWTLPMFALGGLLILDHPVRRATRDLQGGTADDVARAGRWLGDWERSGPYLLAATFAVSVGTQGGSGFGYGAAVTLGVLAGSLGNEALNVAVGRGRPNADKGPWRFDPFSGHASFPSGHTALGFALAGAIDEATEGWAPAAAAYAVATLTGLSRVYDDKHWASDVAAGALVGAWTARLATRRALRAFGLREG
ncbi:MAG: phosphatase PAP2 family protein, partial [Gemmatimonadota bacterium]